MDDVFCSGDEECLSDGSFFDEILPDDVLHIGCRGEAFYRSLNGEVASLPKKLSDSLSQKCPEKNSSEKLSRIFPPKQQDEKIIKKTGSVKTIKIVLGRKNFGRNPGGDAHIDRDISHNPKLDAILKKHHPVGIITTVHPHDGAKRMNFEVYNCGLLIHTSSVIMATVNGISITTKSGQTNIFINIASQNFSISSCLFDFMTAYKLYNSRDEACKRFEVMLEKLIDEKNFYALHHYLIINTLCIGGEILNYSRERKNITFKLDEMDKYTQFAADNIGRDVEHMIPLIRKKISLLP